jgi:lysyl-tRNA synthetase class 1
MDQPVFWSDQLAFGVTRKFSDRTEYVVASGISPSGIVHAGNFREIITSDFVAKSLAERGEDVRFIYSWDDYDRFRKVPANVPDEFEQYIGLPLDEVPDPEGCHESYARHFESRLEDELGRFHMDVEFIRQGEKFRSCEYAPLIREAMRNREKIREILNEYRTEPLEQDWYPLRVYCTECGRDFTEIIGYDGDYTVEYRCTECEETLETDFSRTGNVKPPWRVDWPMRWSYENVAFEPGGKDHSAAGSSRDTGKQIVEQVFDHEAPVYQMYDFISLKGSDKKISSSAGEDTLTLSDLLEVYTPEMVRFLFSETKPNKEFSLAFDEEIIQRYDRFDQIEEAYFDRSVLENERKQEHWDRVYELAVVEVPDQRPVRIPFQHASFVAQTVPEDSWETKGLESLRRTGHVPGEISEQQRQQVLTRLEKAKSWAREYAPEDYRFEINWSGEAPELRDGQRGALQRMLETLRDHGFEGQEELDGALYGARDRSPVDTAEFFEAGYRALLLEDEGPRLSRLIMSIGVEESAEILEKVVQD